MKNKLTTIFSTIGGAALLALNYGVKIPVKGIDLVPIIASAGVVFTGWSAADHNLPTAIELLKRAKLPEAPKADAHVAGK